MHVAKIEDWDFFTKDPSESKWRRDNSEWGRTHKVFVSPEGKAYVSINYYHWEFAARWFSTLTGIAPMDTWETRSYDGFGPNEMKVLEDLGWIFYSKDYGWRSTKKANQAQQNVIWDILEKWNQLDNYSEVIKNLSK
jgi:hypothetical protein